MTVLLPPSNSAGGGGAGIAEGAVLRLRSCSRHPPDASPGVPASGAVPDAVLEPSCERVLRVRSLDGDVVPRGLRRGRDEPDPVVGCPAELDSYRHPFPPAVNRGLRGGSDGIPFFGDDSTLARRLPVGTMESSISWPTTTAAGFSGYLEARGQRAPWAHWRFKNA